MPPSASLPSGAHNGTGLAGRHGSGAALACAWRGSAAPKPSHEPLQGGAAPIQGDAPGTRAVYLEPGSGDSRPPGPARVTGHYGRAYPPTRDLNHIFTLGQAAETPVTVPPCRREVFTVGQHGGLHGRRVAPCLDWEGAGMGGRHARPASTDPVMGIIVLTLLVFVAAVIILAMG